MSYFETTAFVNKELRKYALKLWSVIAATSIIFFLIALNYFHHENVSYLNSSYPQFCLSFLRNWCILMGFTLIACLVIFKFIGTVYQTYWSPFGIKLATLLSAELIISMTYVPYFFVADQHSLPNYFAIMVMVLSTAMGTWIVKLEPLRYLLRQREEALE